MACITTVSSCVTQGNNWYMNITVTEDGTFDDETGVALTPKNLSGASIVMPFKETKGGATIVSPTINITDAALGRISITLSAAQTEPLITVGQGSRKLYAAPKVTYSDGTVDDLFVVDLDIHESWN